MDLNDLLQESDSRSSYYRTLRRSPLHPWNLFSCNHSSGRERSWVPLEMPPSPPYRLPPPRSLRNPNDEGRQNVIGSSARRYAHNSRMWKGGGDQPVHRDEGTLRRGNNQGSSEQSRIISCNHELVIRSQISHGRMHRDVSDDGVTRPSATIESGNSQGNHFNRPSSNIAHQCHHQHQQQLQQQQRRFPDHYYRNHHLDHHLDHHSSRLSNRYQEQGTSSSPSGSVDASNIRSRRRSGNAHRPFVNRRSSIMSNESRGSNARDIAMEARDRLDERFRDAALISQRHRNPSFLEEFNLLFGDDDTFWNDDEMLEVGVQDWLGYVEGWHNPDSTTSTQCSMPKGLSKFAIRRLHKEVYLPKMLRKDKEVKDGFFEHEDCSVCLERFKSGQILVHLPCHHRFHPDCLSPWLEAHGLCPYCRAKVNEEASQ